MSIKKHTIDSSSLFIVIFFKFCCVKLEQYLVPFSDKIDHYLRNMLKELIEILSETEMALLLTTISASVALPNKILELLLKDSNLTQEQIEKKLLINANSYFKNVTLAKEIIYEVIKKQNATPYDDIFLVRTLIFRGLHTQANKLILKLEGNYLYEK